jgi:hypothetical protein
MEPKLSSLTELVLSDLTISQLLQSRRKATIENQKVEIGEQSLF